MTRCAAPFESAAGPLSLIMYYLSKSCSVCKTGCYWIILSRTHNRYLCVEHARLALIGDRLAGWHDESPAPTHPPRPAQPSSLLESLISKGIITSDPSIGRPFAECRYPAPESGLNASRTVERAGISFLRKVRFFLACASVDWQLRRAALPCALTRIERRRRVERSSVNRIPVHAPMLVAAFTALRPLYPRPYLCLFDSLALLEFLAAYECFPRMVFGVIADPFQAHCWLQDGSTVLDDDLERVRRYKPILSV
jgi:Transglutaminase-like superfamily